MATSHTSRAMASDPAGPASAVPCSVPEHDGTKCEHQAESSHYVPPSAGVVALASRSGVPELVLTNARVVTPDAVVEGTLVVRRGRVAAIDTGRSRLPAAEDLGGDLLLPGLVETHTDNLERHLVPRPGVRWPAPLGAVLAHDAQMLASGVTTVLDAVCVGEHRAGKGRSFLLVDSVEGIHTAGAEGLLRADHYLHLRCEVSDPEVMALFEPQAADPLLRLVSVMDHTPGQRQWKDVAVYRDVLRAEGYAESELDGVVAGRLADQARHAATNRTALIDLCRARRIPLASHDDESAAQVADAAADGIGISEFPTTMEAAAAARRAGLWVVMGAPNVVRGGSHSGNVGAADVAAAGLLDALSSDYVPASLLHAAFLLHRQLGLALPDAVATVSATPATMLGLDDRGSLTPGRRADVLRVRAAGDQPLLRSVWCEGRRMM